MLSVFEMDNNGHIVHIILDSTRKSQPKVNDNS